MDGFDIEFEIEAAVSVRVDKFPLQRMWRSIVYISDGADAECRPALWQADAETLIAGYETEWRVIAFIDWPMSADDIESAKRFAISATHAACFAE